MTEREATNRARNLLWNCSTPNDGTLAAELMDAQREGYAAGLANGRAEASLAGITNGLAAGEKLMREEILACLEHLRKSEAVPARREFVAGIIDAVRELGAADTPKPVQTIGDES